MTTKIKSGVIAANSITATQIAANSITASAIASDAIVVADIANNSITSAKIAANAVGSSEIAALTADLSFGDSVKATFGASDDLLIYHDGSNSYVRDAGTGDLRIQATNLRIEATSGEDYLYCASDGAVTVYYDNAAKLATASTGIDVTGTVTATDLLIDTDVIVTDSTNDRVGIGTSSPATKLHINSTNVNQITLQNANGGTNAERIGLSMESNDTFVIRSLNDNSTTRVDNILVANILTGNVGIGTSSPSGWGKTLSLAYTTSDSGITFEGDSRKWGIGGGYSTDSGALRIYDFTASAERMRIDSSGNVGIGESSPDAQLDIYGAGDSTRGLQITATATSGYAEAQFVADSREWRIGSGGSTGIFPNMFYIYDQQGGSGRLLIDSATGDVRLVGGNQMTNALSWWNGTSYELASIENASHPSYNDSGGLVFKTAGTSQAGMAEAMRIDAQGFVGIGTTNPENKLHLMLPTGQNGDILRLSRSSGSYSFKVGVDGNSSYYVSNLSNTKIIDANYQGWVTHPQQPHIVFSPRYSGGSGYANYHHEDTTYSRGTLSSTTVAGYARVTVPTAGLYLVTFHSIGDREQNVRRDMAIAVNGGAVATALTEYDTDGFKYRCMTITLDLAANDYLTFSNDDWYDAGSGSVTTWRKVSITLIG